jgi:phthiocerol/phenolphthiocerol synthesis type-I polyketide synthase E
MLSVPLAESALAQLLGTGGPEIAAVNAPHLCVVAGTPDQIDALRAKVTELGHVPRDLRTSHAFHTRLVEPALPALRAVLATMTLRPPRLPFASNVTGRLITDAEACDPRYWVAHVRGTVRFAEGIGAMLDRDRPVFVEAGPGETLTSLVRVRTNPVDGARPRVVTLLGRRRAEPADEVRATREGLAALWQEGVPVDWASVRSGPAPGRVSLPTYPFERQRFLPARIRPGDDRPARRDRDRWTYLPVWYPSPARPPAGTPSVSDLPVPPATVDDLPAPPATVDDWLLFPDARGLTGRIATGLRDAGQRVTQVHPGKGFAQLAEDRYEIRPGDADDLRRLVRQLSAGGRYPGRVVHAWAVADDTTRGFDAVQNAGLFTVLALAQALGELGTGPVRLDLVTDDLYDVAAGPVRRPERATVLGAATVLGQEFNQFTVAAIDVTIPVGEPELTQLAGLVLAELRAPVAGTPTAYRAGRRWSRGFAPVALAPAAPETVWRPGAGYLVTGAAGESGLIFAEHLATMGARVALVGDGEPAQRVEALAARHPERVTVLRADPADDAHWRAAIGAAKDALGAVAGVIHALDIRGTGLAALKQRHPTADVLTARVRSTLVLDELLRDQPVESFLVSSGTAGLLGGFGQLDNAAAATFLEAFARARTAAGRPTTTIDWSQWDWDDWYERQAAPQVRDHFRRHRQEQGIGPADALPLAASAVAGAPAEVVVAPVDLERVFAGNDQLTPDGFLESISAERPATATGWDPGQVWPDDDVAREVAQIWCDVLGLDGLRVEDDFFDVGGNSLFAIQIIARLRQKFGDLPMSVIFQAATVDGVAAAIRAQDAETIGLDEFEALLSEVENMSAEEAAARLGTEHA